MTDEQLDYIEKGATRWHSVSADTALLLVREIRAVRAALADAKGALESATKAPAQPGHRDMKCKNLDCCLCHGLPPNAGPR
jgi:hypothetical protein